MIEMLVSATLLMGVVMLLRALTKGKISMRLRYGLWLLVAVRLVLPVSFGSSPFSVMNLTRAWDGSVWAAGSEPADGRRDMTGRNGAAQGTGREGEVIAWMADEADKEPAGDAVWRDDEAAWRTAYGHGAGDGETGAAWAMQGVRLRVLLPGLWAVGMAVVGGYMLLGRLRFARLLHRGRREVCSEQLPPGWDGRLRRKKMRVYLLPGLPGPCLVGRGIYVEPALLKEQGRLRHVLAHEYAHALQGDSFWTVVRCVLCMVYWFYPPVWISAWEAKQDSELACDERAIRILGEAERFAYGRTLLDLLTDRKRCGGCAGAVPIAGGRKNHVKERVAMIAGKRKNSRPAAVLTAAVMVLMCGCAFTGAEQSGKNAKRILMTNEAGRQEREDEAAAADAGRQGEDAQTEGAEVAEESRSDNGQPDAVGPDAADGAAETDAFWQMLSRMDDTGLAEAQEVDYAAYLDHLYQGAESPLEDGTWYRIWQEEPDITFYGLYTEDYGFRGMKILIAGDVNTFDQIWLPSLFPVRLQILEEEQGLPRSFVFAMCTANSSTEEKWRLYVADRYDTGTIELYCLDGTECYRQLEDKHIVFEVDQAADQVRLIKDGDVTAGTVDIPDYAVGRTTQAVWDDASVTFMPGEGAEEKIVFLTGIGLKTEESEEIRYGGLPVIACPVEIGQFGARSFTLGDPYVEEANVSGRLR